MSWLVTFFGNNPAPTTGPTTILDAITSTAGLVSNPKDIDPLLDKVRVITALPAISPSDKATLFDVYLKLEAHLAANDPIRTFTKQELRARYDPALRAQLEAYEKKG